MQKEEISQKSKLRMLLGFRSGKLWKKVVAILYGIFCLAVLVAGMVTPPFVPAGLRDVVVFRISVLVLWLWLLTPVIFLSDTPMRAKLPFLRDHLWMRSLVGLLVVFVICAYLFVTVESWHTPEYRAALEAYNLELYGQYRWQI